MYLSIHMVTYSASVQIIRVNLHIRRIRVQLIQSLDSRCEIETTGSITFDS